MNDNNMPLPEDQFEIIRDHGAFLVRRNTALVAEILAMRERANRLKASAVDGFVSKAA